MTGRLFPIESVDRISSATDFLSKRFLVESFGTSNAELPMLMILVLSLGITGLDVATLSRSRFLAFSRTFESFSLRAYGFFAVSVVFVVFGGGGGTPFSPDFSKLLGESVRGVFNFSFGVISSAGDSDRIRFVARFSRSEGVEGKDLGSSFGSPRFGRLFDSGSFLTRPILGSPSSESSDGKS